MIDIRSGHMASGRWNTKSENGIRFFYHRLTLSPEPEFRIGSKDIDSVEIKGKKGDELTIRINFSQDRYAIAQCNHEDLDALQLLCGEDNEAPPTPIKSQQPLIIGICLIFIVAALYETIT